MVIKWLTRLAIFLCFVVGIFLFYHSLAIINEDIGRHIKLGEIIWQTRSVPHTNLLSYTTPNFPFINHHWLSEVIFYGLYHLGGLANILVAKVLILLAAYFILFLTVKNKRNIIAILGFLMSLALISTRTDPRPEIFSYLFLAAFLFVIYRVKENKANPNLLWLLVPLELLWINFHIYFFLGFVVYGAFVIERLILKKLGRQEILTGAALVLITLINPNGLSGALYPLTIFNNYGISSIAENQSIFTFVKHYHAWLFPYNIFLVSIAAMILGFIRRVGKIKSYILELLLFIFFAVSSFQMVRNIGIYAIFFMPAAIALFWDLKIIQKIAIFNKAALIGSIIFMMFALNAIKTNAFYEKTGSLSRFGLFVPKFMQQAMDFFQNNNVPGPIFNDIGTGSYIEWKLYPKQKAFADDRPEAYPVSFWHDTYEPMQTDYKVWQQKNIEYGIRSVMLYEPSADPTEKKLLLNLLKDPGWSLVFINDEIVIFVKKSGETQKLISTYGINSQNIESHVREMTGTFDPTYDLSYLGLGDFLYEIGQFRAAFIPYQKLIDVQPNNPYGYERHALALTANGGEVKRSLAELQKGMSLGAHSSNDYLVLAFLLAADNNLTDARTAIQKAYHLNPDNPQIKSLYSQLVKQPR